MKPDKLKAVFLAKTNLNNDGRILNQIKILQNFYKDNLRIDFILLADTPVTIQLGDGVILHEIKTFTRNSSWLRFIIVLEFTLKTFIKLWRLKPNILHVQDLAVVFPVYLYRLLRGESFKLIYDDHEMPNENESVQYRIYQFFEVRLMKMADVVLFANRERMEILQEQHNLKNRIDYFLNLPYFNGPIKAINDAHKKKLNEVRNEAEKGRKFIMHQGSLEVERGRQKLADFSKKLPDGCSLMIVGVSEHEFYNFVNEYNLNPQRFYWVGSVPYEILPEYWRLAHAAVVMYLPTYINNRLCAPNRLYIAANYCIPVFVNKDNPVLSNFLSEFNIGKYIEDVKDSNDIKDIFTHTYTVDIMGQLKDIEVKKFIDIYESL